jgi:hypothetical protein
MSSIEGIGEFPFSRTWRRDFFAKAAVTATASSVASVDPPVPARHRRRPDLRVRGAV